MSQIIEQSCGIVSIHTDKDLFYCITVIIIVPRPSLGDWVCCACIRINCDRFNLAVRPKDALKSTTVRRISVKSRNSPPALHYSYLEHHHCE